MIQQGKVNFLIDGQWGSTGKGKLAGYLYHKGGIDIGIGDNMPNAGHTFTKGGKDFILKALPTSCLFEGMVSLIGPQAVLGEEQFQYEMEMIKNELGHYPEVYIHPLASTGQGSCSAYTKKMWRKGDANLARDSKVLEPYVKDVHELLHDAIANGKTALSEGSQGFDLSLNCGHAYPHVTSRDCLIGRMMDNAGCPHKDVGDIIASLRIFPIRVGSTENTSGPYYDDQMELDWSYISEKSGMKVEEKTTVTQRIRRVFSFSDMQARKFCQFVRPDYAFLNFVNYYSDKEEREIAIRNVASTLGEYGCDLRLLGTGADLHDMIETNSSDIFSNQAELFAS